MPKLIKFKDPAALINYGGRQIGPHNITEELYEELVKVAPSHADLFEVVEEEKGKAAKASSGKVE